LPRSGRENTHMISFWNRVVSSALDRVIADPLVAFARWDSDPPPALTWALSNDRLVIASAAVVTAVVWYLVEPIVVTYDTFAYLNAAKFIVGAEGGAFTYFRPPLLPFCWR
jgi:hypothetical protein